jgi:hypothetical protein
MNERLKAHFEAIDRKFAAHKIQLDNLSETAWTTALHAAQAAARTHHEDKLAALQNATLNAALPGAPSDDLQHIFVNWVDEFAPVHLRLLTVMLYPERFDPHVPDYRRLLGINQQDPDRSWVFLTTHVSPRRGLIASCLDDLVTRNLLTYDDLPAQERLGLPAPGELGWEFLIFITEPRL